ncbi:unnamed protein product [Cuscuta campestris]|uniref:Transposase (putative) gypsy type domain-containing protein n=1 Tax=Cuscuta campestris TaxID=132261 RepID=A0A484LE20_9ASTE|nr:unnamed protein product [Cuscuta campestris]
MPLMWCEVTGFVLELPCRLSFDTCWTHVVATVGGPPVVSPASGSSLRRLTRRNLERPRRLIRLPPSYIKASNPLHFSLFALRLPELSPVKFLSLAIQPSEPSKFPLPPLLSFPVMSSFSDRISSSEDCSSEDSNSSSSTGSSSPDSMPGQVPNSSIPDPHPVNQMPGEVFMGRNDPIDDEPGPYDPENETRDAWEERLHVAGYFPLPTFYVLDIPSHVSKIALNKIRRRLPDGYTLLYEPNWPNIVEPHREDRIGFHTISLDTGIVFPLRPLLTEVCHAFRILLSQITPNAHRYLYSFVNICTHLKIVPTLRLFLFCFEVLPGGTGCEDMEFEEFAILDDQPAGETGGSQANTTRTFPVNPETVEILDEDEPQDNRSKGKEKEKTGRRTKKVATTHPSYAKKRARPDSEPAGQTIEEAFINLGLRLKEAGEIGPHTVDRLGMSSPFEVDRLKREKEEMALILKSQADELIRLSGLAGAMKTEISQLKEENGRLMDEVSEAKREMVEKEETFPGRAAAWVEENKAVAARVMTTMPEATMESFRLLYREPEGKKMITAVGSFGFKCGQKKDRAASHRILLKRDPAFTAASYGLAPIPKEDPTPPFPLD